MTDSPKKNKLGVAVVVVMLGVLLASAAAYVWPVGVCTRALWTQPGEVVFFYTSTSHDGFNGRQRETGGVSAIGSSWVKLWKGMRAYDRLEPSAFEQTVVGSHGPNYTINIQCGEHRRSINAGADFVDPRASRMLSSLLEAAGD